MPRKRGVECFDVGLIHVEPKYRRRIVGSGGGYQFIAWDGNGQKATINCQMARYCLHDAPLSKGNPVYDITVMLFQVWNDRKGNLATTIWDAAKDTLVSQWTNCGLVEESDLVREGCSYNYMARYFPENVDIHGACFFDRLWSIANKEDLEVTLRCRTEAFRERGKFDADGHCWTDHEGRRLKSPAQCLVAIGMTFRH